MLTIVLEWLYILVVAYCLGFVFSRLIHRMFDYKIENTGALLVTGVILLTVYAQTFSLFYKVGIVANIVLVIATVLSLVIFRKEMIQDIKKRWDSCSTARKWVILCLFFLWAYYTSRGYMVSDTALYHGQSIRWIEEYGVVEGLGNFHERFAYNSSLFSLYALFSLSFLTGGFSMHTINGFIALVLCITTLDIAKAWKRKSMQLSDFAGAAAIYYLSIICDEIIAPSADYAVMCIIFYIVITWLRLLEKKEKSIVPYALLCVVGVYTLTLKLTAGLILVLLLKPAIYLIKNKKWKDIVIYLLMGILVVAPWLIRGIIISGWLLYPLPSIDLFQFDWEMNATNIAIDANQILIWGRALNGIPVEQGVVLVELPITEWFGHWFDTTLFAIEKLLILADLACIVLFLGAFLFHAVRCKKVEKENWDTLLVIGTTMCCYWYWQNSAPLMRYGYAYVLLFAALMLGWIVIKLRVSKVLFVMLIGFGLYKLTWLARYTAGCALLPNYIWQEDYESYEVEAYDLDGVVVYVPVEEDGLPGYYAFPAVPVVPEVELRGDGLEDGFRRVEK